MTFAQCPGLLTNIGRSRTHTSDHPQPAPHVPPVKGGNASAAALLATFCPSGALVMVPEVQLNVLQPRSKPVSDQPLRPARTKGEHSLIYAVPNHIYPALLRPASRGFVGKGAMTPCGTSSSSSAMAADGQLQSQRCDFLVSRPCYFCHHCLPGLLPFQPDLVVLSFRAQ